MIIIGNNYRVYVGEGYYRPDLYGDAKTSRNLRFQVMVWACIFYNGVGTLKIFEANITARSNLECLEKNLWPVLAKEFPQGGAIFQDDGVPAHAT